MKRIIRTANKIVDLFIKLLIIHCTAAIATVMAIATIIFAIILTPITLIIIGYKSLNRKNRLTSKNLLKDFNKDFIDFKDFLRNFLKIISNIIKR
jgi:hypothetical protein